jgi:hypothetical protein
MVRVLLTSPEYGQINRTVLRDDANGAITRKHMVILILYRFPLPIPPFSIP